MTRGPVTTARAEMIGMQDGREVWCVRLWDLTGTYVGTRYARSERGALRVMDNHSKRLWA